MQTLRTFSTSPRYGPLQDTFSYDLREGYTALVGPNNAGKSALLQFLFRSLVNDSEFGAGRIALILTDREYVEPSTQTGERTRTNWNQDLVTYMGGELPLTFASNPVGPPRAELPRLLMHGDLVEQFNAINQLLVRLGLRSYRLSGPQEIRFEDIAVYVQGSGLRGTLPILAALTNTDVQAILIDEPELSLEPRLQKVLRDLLIEKADEKRAIVVSTHSHLFLNRNEVDANQMVIQTGSGTNVRTLTTERELYDVTFDLLGSSTEDLFFPSNYIIVEGSSDQAIVVKVLELLNTPPPTIKVLAARGVDAVRNAVESVYRASIPLVVNDSPYADRVVALIDRPPNPDAASVRRLGDALRDRRYVLDEPSIEAYLPEALYDRADRSKDGDLGSLDQLGGDRIARDRLKREISNQLAEALTEDDFDSMPIVVEAAKRAIADAS